MPSKVSWYRFVLLTLSLSCFIGDVSASFPSFSQDHIIVGFDPYISYADVGSYDAYDESGLIILIAKIATRFSKIVINEISENHDPAFSVAVIPRAVATYNRNHRKPTERAMELIMTFKLMEYNSNQNFDSLKRLADQANTIYPGTVKTLLGKYEGLSVANVQTVKEQLINAQTKLSTSNIAYNLGTMQSIDACGNWRTKFESYLPPILPYLNVIMFSEWGIEKEISGEMTSALERITRRFKDCKQKLTTYNSKIAVVFRTGWPDTYKTTFQNYSNLVTFWETMNEWAVKSNTSVCLYEAFDNPYQVEGFNHNGWFKLVKYSLHGNVSDFVFEEKQSCKLYYVVLSKVLGQNEFSCSSTNSLVISSIVGMSIIIIILLVVLGKAFYDRNSRFYNRVREERIGGSELTKFG